MPQSPKQPPRFQERLADVIELRAADPRYLAIAYNYFSDIPLPPEAKVLEIGCGTGAVIRTLAQRQGIGEALGVDPSPVFVARARSLAQNIPNLAFEVGDGRALELVPERFDTVLIHTTLCHVPEPERLVAEAFRVLRPGGTLAVFDGDYATATVAKGDYDPLEACVHAFRENFVHDSWLVRRLPQLISAAGFEVTSMRSHGYIEDQQSGYMQAWIDRGVAVLANAGRISKETADAIKAEVQRRNAAKTWFGFIGFASIIGRKPG